MKQFTMPKVGYTSGAYGCTGEYFTLILINGKQTRNFTFHGLYGAEERVRSALIGKGWRFFHTSSPFGKLVRSDVNRPYILNEYEMVELIKNNFKNSCEVCPRVAEKKKRTCGAKRCKDFLKKYDI